MEQQNDDIQWGHNKHFILKCIMTTRDIIDEYGVPLGWQDAQQKYSLNSCLVFIGMCTVVHLYIHLVVCVYKPVHLVVCVLFSCKSSMLYLPRSHACKIVEQATLCLI